MISLIYYKEISLFDFFNSYLLNNNLNFTPILLCVIIDIFKYIILM